MCLSYSSGSDVPAPPVRSWWAGTARNPFRNHVWPNSQICGWRMRTSWCSIIHNFQYLPASWAKSVFLFSKSTSDGLQANKPWAGGCLHRQLEARGCSRACQLLTSQSAFSIPALFDLCQYWFSEERISELSPSTSSCPLVQIVSLQNTHENISLLTCSQQTSTENHV